MFYSISDNAIERWELDDGTEYAVMIDDSPDCPAGDVADVTNCARRDTGDWWGDTSILDRAHHRATLDYGASTFEAVATSPECAQMVVQMFAHWAEGDVYLIGRSTPDGEEETIGGHYTADGLPPSLEDLQEYFRTT